MTIHLDKLDIWWQRKLTEIWAFILDALLQRTLPKEWTHKVCCCCWRCNRIYIPTRVLAVRRPVGVCGYKSMLIQAIAATFSMLLVFSCFLCCRFSFFLLCGGFSGGQTTTGSSEGRKNASSRGKSGVTTSSVSVLLSFLLTLLVDTAIPFVVLLILLVVPGRGGLILCGLLLGLRCHRPDVLLPPYSRVEGAVEVELFSIGVVLKLLAANAAWVCYSRTGHGNS